MSHIKSLGFVILNPENNATALRITTKTIADHYPYAKTLTVLSNRYTEISENKKYAEVFQGGNTITSLIDAGVQNSKTEWCFIVIAGTYLKYSSLKRYEYFLRGDREILYPVVDKKYVFDEACINGILMPKKAIEEVGVFGDNSRSIQSAKLFWAIRAIEKNYKFKAIIGARLV